jgi:hypothetical protein
MAIRARHARGVATLFGPERATRRLRAIAAATHRHFHQGDRQHFSLRFDMRLAPVVRVRAAPQPLLSWEPASDFAGAQPTAPPSARLSIVERIFARERRVETLMTMREALREVVTRRRGGGASAPPPPPTPSARPVEMVVRHPASSPPETARAAPPDAPHEETSERLLRPNIFTRPAVQTPAALSAAELGRVTDHVVCAIDRRLVAQRERRGKI